MLDIYTAISILTLTQNDYEKSSFKAAIAIPQRWSVAHAAQRSGFSFFRRIGIPGRQQLYNFIPQSNASNVMNDFRKKIVLGVSNK